MALFGLSGEKSHGNFSLRLIQLNTSKLRELPGGAATARQGAGGCSLREGSCAGVCDRGRLRSVPPAVFGLARKKFRENFLHL